MEQPLLGKKSLFSIKAKKEGLNFFQLALPMFFTQLALQLVQVNSVIQSGNYSSDVLAGILLAGNLWFPIFIGLGGIIFFVTPMVAQLYGAKRIEETGYIVRQAMWLCIPIVALGMLILSQGPKILELAKVDQEIIFHADEYLSYFIFALPAILLSQPLRSLSEGITKPIPITIANLIMLLIAIFCNYAFIYGNFGFPEMGAKGAGLSAIISTWTAFTGLSIYFGIAKIYKPTNLFSNLELPDSKTVKEIMKGGLPIGFGNFIELSMFSGAGILLGRLGSDVIAAHGIALNIGGLLFMVPLAVGNAAAVRVGNNIGSGNPIAAKYSSYFSMRLAVLLGMINSLLLILFSEVLISNIYTSQSEVISLAVILLYFAAFFQVADGLIMGGVGSLRGYKYTFVPMLIMAFSYWAIGMPIGIGLSITNIFGEPIGAIGMWIGMSAGLSVAAVLIVYRVRVISKEFING